MLLIAFSGLAPTRFPTMMSFQGAHGGKMNGSGSNQEHGEEEDGGLGLKTKSRGFFQWVAQEHKQAADNNKKKKGIQGKQDQ